MKNIWLISFLLLSGISYSQVTIGSSSELGNVDKEKYYTAMALQNWDLNKLNTKNTSVGNNVFIEQVGSDNIIQSSIFSPDAEVILGQDGNNNNIDLQLESQKIRYNVVQNGNNNYLQDYTFAPFEAAELNLQQNGNENQVLKYGTNSITNKLELNLTGDSKMLIVRSFQ